MTITSTRFFVSGTTRSFNWDFAASVQHPASNFEDDFPGSAGSPLKATPAQARATIVKQVQNFVSTFVLAHVGPPVPAERISVVLL